MVRFTLPAALVAACCAAAPAAEASVVPVDVQSTVAATAEQVPVVASVTTTVTETARPAVTQVRAEVNAATGAAVPATDPAVANATDLAGPTVERAGYTTAAAVTVATGGPRELHSGASATPGRAARFTRPGRGHTGQSAAQGGGRAALAHLPHGTSSPPAGAPADIGADSAPRTVAHHSPSAPDPAPRTGGGGNVASAPAAGFTLGGAALLTLAVCLARPRLRRRLLIRPAVPRPVAFVVLLERPG